MANNKDMLIVYLFDCEDQQYADGFNMHGHNYIGSDARYILVRRSTGYVFAPSHQVQNPVNAPPSNKITRIVFHRNCSLKQ